MNHFEYEIQALVGRDIPDDKRKSMPEEDFAGKGRSYPIDKPEDVEAAAASIGRAGDDNYDHDTLKRNIISIAKRKGADFEAKLPDDWKEDKLAASDPTLCLLIGDDKVQDGLRRIPVALVTRGFKGKQKYAVTSGDLAQLVANFQKRDADVVVDYEHSTLRAGDGIPTPTAGWLKKIENKPDENGVLWGWVEYTDQGAQSIAAKDYKYVSPVLEWGLRDKRTGEQQGCTLTSLALTKQPLFEKLPSLPLVACEGWSFDRGDVADERRKENKTVKITKVIAAAGAAGRVRLVADDNTETEMQVEGLRVVSMADVKRGSDGRFDFSKLPQGADVLVGSDVLTAMTVQTEIDAAVKEGKITPAQREFYESSAIVNLDGFRKLVSSMKPAVDLKEHGTSADGVKLESLSQVEHLIRGKVDEKLAANKGMSHGQALKLVASENRGLFVRRAQLQRQRGGR